ncbi:hypothetical protein [Actinomyces minihominis]|nr:hypothetical protein [Actinomyces minihominis]
MTTEAAEAVATKEIESLNLELGELRGLEKELRDQLASMKVQ